jgi:hypothetical protein
MLKEDYEEILSIYLEYFQLHMDLADLIELYRIGLLARPYDTQEERIPDSLLWRQ